ncbi:hypothetical protein SDC9_138673 [bioreactor metagenome]|uniref:Uncharacterized protein n=1 Tax=bioreactor metagenome TaxID=1076179 RepID=A0A645DSW4_9ZZZZ
MKCISCFFDFLNIDIIWKIRIQSQFPLFFAHRNIGIKMKDLVQSMNMLIRSAAGHDLNRLRLKQQKSLLNRILQRHMIFLRLPAMIGRSIIA